MMDLSWFVVSLVAGVLVLLLMAALIALVVALARRAKPAPRLDEPMRVERVERISREIEKINEMQTSGRISAEEAAELKAALEGERRAWADSGAEFARQSGAACAGLARKRLTKSSNAVLAGVCGGLAEWLGVDATLVRIVYALLTLFMAGFPGIILYIVLWIVLPPPAVGSAPQTVPDVQPSGQKPGKGWLIILLLCLLLAVPLILVLLAFFLLGFA